MIIEPVDFGFVLELELWLYELVDGFGNFITLLAPPIQPYPEVVGVKHPQPAVPGEARHAKDASACLATATALAGCNANCLVLA